MSSFVKTQLKAARDAIQSKNFEYSLGVCDDILEADDSNYNALVFRALSLKELNRKDESEASYERAILASPAVPLAYQGMMKLFESHNDLVGLTNVLERMSLLYIGLGDGEKVRQTLEKRLDSARTNKDIVKTLACLLEYLPNSLSYDLLEVSGEAVEQLKEIVQIKRDMLDTSMAIELKARRMRLGTDPLAVLKFKIEKEFVVASDLDHFLEMILGYSFLPASDRIIYLDQYLQFIYKKLIHSTEAKNENLQKVINAASSLVNAEFFSILALSILMETSNVALAERDLLVLEPFLTEIMVSHDSYAKVMRCLLSYRNADVPRDLETLQQCLSLLSHKDLNSRNVLGDMLSSKLLLDSHDILGAKLMAENTISTITETNLKMGLCLDKVAIEANLILGTCFLRLGNSCTEQALNTFKSIVQLEPLNTDALLGLGRAYLANLNLEEAQSCFDLILDNIPNQIEALAEAGWILYLRKDFHNALKVLKESIQKAPNGELYFRVAKVYWELGDEYRTNKEYTHAHLIQAIKLDQQFSPSFTFLGHYYRDLEQDLTRATKCYSKAISINPRDEDAVLAIANIWIIQGNVDTAMDLLKQFVDLDPRASWAWERLAILTIDTSPVCAIPFLQTALRISSDNAIGWATLGEAYFLSGKYTAALKSLERATELDDTYLPAYYFKALVNEKLLYYPEAIENYKHILEFISSSTSSLDDLKVPSIIGLAETNVFYGKELYEEGAYGACLAALIEAISISSNAISTNPAFSMMIGDSCLLIYNLLPNLITEHEALLAAQISASIRTIHGDKITCSPFSGSSNIGYFIECACVCYQAFIVDLKSKDPLILAESYHNLAQSFYNYHLISDSLDSLNFAIAHITTALQHFPSSWKFWNALGIYNQLANKGLAEKAFVRAAEFKDAGPIPCSNLGFFYLMNDDLELAKLYFEKAQFLDLDFAEGWLGLAMTAEIIGDESFKHYEHSFDLAGVTNFEILYQFSRKCFQSPTKQSSFLTEASFALLKCTESKYVDSAVLNTFGIILERQKQYSSAILMLKKALAMAVKPAEEQAISENLGRCLCANGQFEESIKYYEPALAKGNSYTLAGCGLALYSIGSYEESLALFQEALQRSENGPRDTKLISEVTLLLSQVLYALGTPAHIEIAKQQLFACFAADPTFIPAITGLCALGIMTEDWVLAQTAAAELIKLDVNLLGNYDVEVDYVLSALFLKSGEGSTASRFLQKTIHRYPWKAVRWSNLSEHLLVHTNKFETARKISVCGLSVGCTSQTNTDTQLGSVDEMVKIYRNCSRSEHAERGPSVDYARHLSRAMRLQPSNPVLIQEIDTCRQLVKV